MTYQIKLQAGEVDLLLEGLERYLDTLRPPKRARTGKLSKREALKAERVKAHRTEVHVLQARLQTLVPV